MRLKLQLEFFSHRLATVTVLLMLSACNQTTYRLNEVGAQSSLRTLRSAENVYREKDALSRFGTLEQLHANGLIDAELASGTKDGYKFEEQVRQDSFSATATPVQYNVTGTWSYYVDQSGVIRGSVTQGKQPGAQDAPIRYQ